MSQIAALRESETDRVAAGRLLAPPDAAEAPRTGAVVRTARRRLVADRVARWTVSAGGLAIIAAISGILIFIVAEVSPLMGDVRVEPTREVSVPGVTLRALVADEHRTHVVGLDGDGAVRAIDLSAGRVVAERQLLGGAPLHAASPPGEDLLAGSTADGRVLLQPVGWDVTFEGEERRIRPRLPEPIELTLDDAGRAIDVFAARHRPGGLVTVVAQLADGNLAMVRREQIENQFTGEATDTLQRAVSEAPFRFTTLVLDGEQRSLYGGTRQGELVWWPLADGGFGRPMVASAGTSEITALTFLLGGQAVAVGQANGDVSVWFPVRQESGELRPVRIRELPRAGAAIRLILPSSRERSFLALDATGQLGLYHSTSHRTLWTGPVPTSAATSLVYAPKADGAVLAGPGRLLELDIDNPHPETTWQTLFGRVWYEGYSEPAHVWQSSGSADAFEAKLSLTPLVVGTLKGTFYSLILAIPLAVCGAMYASQFMHPFYRGLVKPTVEIMAALPSVVLGFLAGLWLAPRLEQTFPSLLLMGLVLPPLVLAAGWVWQRIAPHLGRALLPGSEVLAFVAVLAGGMWACIQLSPGFEGWVFAGSFPTWLHERTDLTYDQRNAIVVGLAMGFAVIPIIFSVSEDAFSTVPLTLISGSLALGATRWQTATRVVLPSASPGIFSAIMIGFGRAIGETMIVLMATGNTPIMDWNPFNGFRTLSANIAVEVPEAPQFGTLYRVLFLAALMLFVVTFVVNSAAEIVRHRLRRRYGQL
jgi:phosphate transport system permease protein